MWAWMCIETIAIAVAEPGRLEPVYEGEIANIPKRIEHKIQRLSERYGGGLPQSVYEAVREWMLALSYAYPTMGCVCAAASTSLPPVHATRAKPMHCLTAAF
jgi:hypothetical protein